MELKCDAHVWTSLQHGTNMMFTHKKMNGQMNEHVEHLTEVQNQKWFELLCALHFHPMK